MNRPERLDAHDDGPLTWGRMTMCETMGASHAFLEEVGALELLLRGESLEDLLVEGGRALGSRMCGPARPGPAGPWIDVEIRAGGREALLTDWLNHLLSLAVRDRWAPVECEVIAVSDGGLRARVCGVPLAETPRLGKAVIRPGSFIVPGWCGLQVEVSLVAPRAPRGHRAGKRNAPATSRAGP